MWRAIRARLKEEHPGLEVAEEIEATEAADPEWSDPWTLICWARLEGTLSDAEAELIFWTKLQNEGIEEVSALLGLGAEAARSCRKRAIRKLAAWARGLGDSYPPRDPQFACRLRKLAQEPSRLARILGRGSDPKRPRDVLGG